MTDRRASSLAPRNRLHWIAPAVAAGALVGLPHEVAAQNVHAKAHLAMPSAPARDVADDAKLRSGIALFEAHNHARALAEFERVYAKTKHARALYWIARTNEDSGHPLNALRAFKKYLREAGPVVGANESLDVLRRIQMMTMEVAAVTVTASAGAKIALDGEVVGEAPLDEPIYVDSGTHTISADGAEPKTIDVTGDARVSVELAPTAAPPASPAPITTASEASVPATSSGPAFLTIGGLAVAGILAAGSVYFATQSAASASDLTKKKAELGASRSELESLQGDTRLNAGVALGLGLSALATAGLTLFVFRKSGSSETQSRVVTTGSGIVLDGRF